MRFSTTSIENTTKIQRYLDLWSGYQTYPHPSVLPTYSCTGSNYNSWATISVASHKIYFNQRLYVFTVYHEILFKQLYNIFKSFSSFIINKLKWNILR